MAELDIQRELTKKYIASDPTVIALIPTVETATATGGQTRIPGTPKVPQTFKRIAQSELSRPTVTIAGVERIIDYVLLGAWDSDMDVGDHWVDEKGTKYEVVLIQAGHGYEKKGFVERKFPKNAS